MPVIKKQSIKRVKTDIDGFEEISHGGIPEGRTTLVSGSSGSGKTIFAIQFIHNGIIKNDPGVFVTFEETPKDIKRNMLGFGWNLEKLEKENKLAFVDASPHPREVETGSYDLSAFLARIKHAIKKVKAKRVAIDSVSALFTRYKDPALIRRELYVIAAELKNFGVTTILTGERTETGSISRFGVEEFVSDNVVLLHNKLELERRIRSVEILKFRGADHDTQEAPLLIDIEGMQIFPKPSPTFAGAVEVKKLSTGIPTLDEMTYGGFFRGSTTLVTGASGTGKTLISLQFIVEGARKGERGIYIAFEESKSQLYRAAQSFGWELESYVNNGMVVLISGYPEEKNTEAHFKAIKEQVLAANVKRVVIDSLSGLSRVFPERTFRSFVVGMNAFLKNKGITTYMVNTTSSLITSETITDTQLSTTTDNIIMLKYSEFDGVMHRLLTVLKERGSEHDKSIRTFSITSKHGITIDVPLKGVEGLLSGSARVIQVRFGEEEGKEKPIEDAESEAEKAFLKEVEKENI